MSRKFISILLILIMSLSGSILAFADTESINDSYTDILTETDDAQRSTKIPSTFYNLQKGRYQFSADSFSVSLFTNYYFCPNAKGELTVYANMTVGKRGVPTQLKVHLMDLNKKNYVSGKYVSNETQMTSDGTYTTYVTVKKTFTGLDPNKFYFFEISKTNDGQYAKAMGGYVEA